MMRRLVLGLWGALALSGAGCDDDDGGSTVVAVQDGSASDGGRDGAASVDAAGGSDAPVTTLYQRLGSGAGVRTVITDFVVNRVLKDAKINGYFLNKSTDGARLIDCLVLQVGNLTGGPEVYPSAGCRNMRDSHKGLKISMQDFNDLAGHLVDSLKGAGVAQADIDTIVGALVPMADDIVEDKANAATVYHRVGRKPAIAAVVANFINRVVADVRINGFFTQTNAGRLQSCLVRQVCSIDGPCKYGEEVDGAEPGVSLANPCKDMKSSHAGLTAPPGAAGGRPITKADFDALVDDLVKELDAAGVAAADKMAILGALAPTCDDIVAGGLGCPGKTIIALVEGNALVTFDSKSPATASAPIAITGLPAGEALVGLTLRPANGTLYALGAMSRLYTVDRATGAATAIGSAFTTALSGASFGFDFNPTVDRIRLVSDAEQNLRLHPETGAVVDFDAAAAGVQPDATLSPAGGIAAAAYTNSFAGATSTTLFAIDPASDTLVRIGGPGGMPSPNAGAVTAVGALGVDATGPTGFDIAAAGNAAFAVLRVGGLSQLHQIDLGTGAAKLVGPVGGAAVVRAIAVAP